jgi:hypothetical protein
LLNSNIDTEALIRSFNLWASKFVQMEAEEVLNGDGKALRSTVAERQGSGQNFSQVVSLFCKRLGLVVDSEAHQTLTLNELR